MVFYLSAYATGGYYAVQEAFISIQARKFDVNILMILSAIGAASIGEPTEGAILMFLFSLSNTLENHSMNKTDKGIKALLKIMPQTAKTFKKISKPDYRRAHKNNRP